MLYLYITMDSRKYMQYNISNNNTADDKKTIFSSKSKRGKYYYYLSCGPKMKMENTIFYKSEEEAERAGKILHKKCK